MLECKVFVQSTSFIKISQYLTGMHLIPPTHVAIQIRVLHPGNKSQTENPLHTPPFHAAWSWHEGTFDQRRGAQFEVFLILKPLYTVMLVVVQSKLPCPQSEDSNQANNIICLFPYAIQQKKYETQDRLLNCTGHHHRQRQQTQRQLPAGYRPHQEQRRPLGQRHDLGT